MLIRDSQARSSTVYDGPGMPVTEPDIERESSFTLWGASAAYVPVPMVAEGVAHVIMAEPYDPRVKVVYDGPGMPVSDIDVTREPSWTLFGQRRRFVAGTHEGRTDISDQPSAEWISERVVEALNMSAVAFPGIEPSRPARNGGAIRLLDPAGDLDHWVNPRIGWEGFPLTILRGTPGRPLSEYATVARLFTDGVLYDHDKKLIKVRDFQGAMEVPGLMRLYGGTGGADGDEAIAGKVIPWGSGYIESCTPVLVNANARLFQVSDGEGQATDVYDGGSRLGDPIYPDYATLAELLAATIADGDVATCKNLGYFRLGGASLRRVTAKVVCPHATRGDIVKEALRRARIGLSYPGDFDVERFEAFDAAFTHPVGVWWGEQISAADALDALLHPVLGFWTFGVTGKLIVSWLRDPELETADLIFNRDDLMSGALPAMVDHASPRSGTSVEWRTNFAPLSVGDMSESAGLTEEQKRYWQQRAMLSTVENSATLSNFPGATPRVAAALFRDEVDARTERDRQSALMGDFRREPWNWPVKIDPFLNCAGMVVQIENYGRYEFGSTRRFICLGPADARGLDGAQVLRLWG
jgi:hypothetical protein